MNFLTNLEDRYHDDLKYTLGILRPFLNDKQYKKAISKSKNDLKSACPENLEAICELTICSFFAKKYPCSFKYEDAVNPPKNVDCSFVENETKFNVEIKCPDYSKQHIKSNSPGINIVALSRSNKKEIFSLERKISESLPSAKYGSSVQLPNDNKMKDYLLLANSKFIKSDVNLNVLIVCCDNPIDVQRWFFYLHGHQGLFTNSSFHPQIEYNLVDAVVLTNTYHRHYQYWSKYHLTNNWDFGSAFNLVTSNPFRLSNKENEINLLSKIVPNFSNDLDRFTPMADVDIEPFVLESIKIPSFVNEVLIPSNKYFFEPIAEPIVPGEAPQAARP
jgi:hypothetical protein